ncbi:MAG: single-stranded-DNA-specific exonuclease RecJ [Puniceicoccales bacterium]|nr:single-stranded-DNA-specific exonuclease RecJ [Puniceicoccales bacterium]
MKKQLHWKETACDEEAANRLHRLLRIPLVVAKILSSKGLRDAQTARLFIESRLTQLDDPFKIVNMHEAVARVWQAMLRREKVFVFGDYDADGITSTVLMVHLLCHFDIDVKYFVPRRFEEGYGLSRNVVERAYSESKPDLVIALDCGTNSTEEIEWMRTQQTDVVIIDHHRANRTLAQDLLLVNPNVTQENCRSTLGIFCTAGLMFKFSHGFLKHGRQCRDPRAASYNLKGQLDLVTLATIADVVPLVGENRIFVKYGLTELQHPKRIGTQAIMRQAITEMEQPLMPSDISFKVCPRINASGRIADASLPVEMFLSNDAEAADRMAMELSRMNAERQRIESEITREASQMVETHYPECKSIVLFNDNWHTGVIGIVAGKLMQRYRKPCVVLSREENDMAKGSGRCVSGLNLVDLLSKCSHLLGSWGGHPQAAGIGMPRENVDRFRDAFEVRVSEALQIVNAGNDLEIAAWVNVADMHETLMRHLRQLEPYGQENQQPIFGIRAASFAAPPHIFGNNQQHFNFTLTDGRRNIHGVAWHMAEYLSEIPKTFDAAIRVNNSYWNGNRGIQVELVDFRTVSKS